MRNYDHRFTEEMARDILDAFAARFLVVDAETARMWLRQVVRAQISCQPYRDPRVEYRTCVRPGEKTVRMQIRGPADEIASLPVAESDDTDEQMCDDWTDWEEV